MRVWMKVSEDKYELPEVIADSATELARILGVTRNAIDSARSHAKERGYNCYYKCVEVDDEEDAEK